MKTYKTIIENSGFYGSSGKKVNFNMEFVIFASIIWEIARIKEYFFVENKKFDNISKIEITWVDIKDYVKEINLSIDDLDTAEDKIIYEINIFFKDGGKETIECYESEYNQNDLIERLNSEELIVDLESTINKILSKKIEEVISYKYGENFLKPNKK